MAVPSAIRLLLLFLSLNLSMTCNEKEKQALLSFKNGLSDPSNRLSSWSDTEDCCRWPGVRCSNITGRVMELNLSTPLDSPYMELSAPLSSNKLEGQFPRVSTGVGVEVLNMAKNLISGPISPFFNERVNDTDKLTMLDASNYLLSGELGHCGCIGNI